MKKGLLSLLAVALTIVSCQNYDDQFAELTGLVNTLSTEVAGLSEVKTSLSALSTTVNGLKASIDADLPGLSTGIESALEDIEALEVLLSDVTSEDDLVAITDAIALVQADVKTLLEADVVINQNITINNAATLEYVSTLIAHGEDDPSVIINGKVTIATALLTPTEITTTSLIASKLRTVLGDGAADPGVSITSTQVLDISNLAFVDDDVTIIGEKQNIEGLKTISGNFTLDYGKRAETLDLSDLTSVGGDVLIAATTANSATAVDFGILDVTGSVGTPGAGTNVFPNALTIDTSNASYISMTADKATSIESSQDGTVASLAIDATAGGTLNMNSLKVVTGAFSLTGSDTTVAHFDALTTTGALAVVQSSEAHFGALTTFTNVAAVGAAALNFGSAKVTQGTFSVAAPVLVLSSLASVVHASSITGDDLAISSLVSVTVGSTFNSNGGPLDLSNAHFSAALTTVATTVAIGGNDAVLTDIVGSTAIDHLTITDQRVTMTAITNGNLQSLNVTTANDGALSFTSNANLSAVTELNVSGFDTVDVSASALVSMTTAGTIKSLTLLNNDDLESLVIGHTYSTDYTDAQSVSIIGHALLEAVDLGTVVRLENAIIIDNAALATITAPDATDLLTVGATLNYRVYSNLVSVTYTDAVAAVQDGINDSAYVQAKIANASLASWKTYLVAVSAVNSIVGTYSFSYDGESTVGATAHTLGTGSTLLAPAATYVASAANGFEANALLDPENPGSFAADGTTRQTGALLTWAGEIDTLAELSACE